MVSVGLMSLVLRLFWPKGQPGQWHITRTLVTNPLLLGEKAGFLKNAVFQKEDLGCLGIARSGTM